MKVTEDQYTLASLVQACKLRNDQIRTRLPIQHWMLSVLLCQINVHFNKVGQLYLGLLYSTIVSTMYFGLFRISEVTSGAHPVLAKDVHIGENKKKMMFILRSSKTHGKNLPPQIIKISASEGLRSNQLSCKKLPCPFSLLRDYAAERGPFAKDSEPFFIFRYGSPVQPRHVSSCLKTCIKEAGFDSKFYGTHSLCAGRSCDLYKLGLTIETIKKVRHWRSNAVYRYIKN